LLLTPSGVNITIACSVIYSLVSGCVSQLLPPNCTLTTAFYFMQSCAHPLLRVAIFIALDTLMNDALACDKLFLIPSIELIILIFIYLNRITSLWPSCAPHIILLRGMSRASKEARVLMCSPFDRFPQLINLNLPPASWELCSFKLISICF